jgi:hypothetical protein
MKDSSFSKKNKTSQDQNKRQNQKQKRFLSYLHFFEFYSFLTAVGQGPLFVMGCLRFADHPDSAQRSSSLRSKKTLRKSLESKFEWDGSPLFHLRLISWQRNKLPLFQVLDGNPLQLRFPSD